MTDETAWDLPDGGIPRVFPPAPSTDKEEMQEPSVVLEDSHHDIERIQYLESECEHMRLELEKKSHIINSLSSIASVAIDYPTVNCTKYHTRIFILLILLILQIAFRLASLVGVQAENDDHFNEPIDINFAEELGTSMYIYTI